MSGRKIRAELEELLPPHCLVCEWGQPGPHAKGCKMYELLKRIGKLKEPKKEKKR